MSIKEFDNELLPKDIDMALLNTSRVNAVLSQFAAGAGAIVVTSAMLWATLA